MLCKVSKNSVKKIANPLEMKRLKMYKISRLWGQGQNLIICLSLLWSKCFFPNFMRNLVTFPSHLKKLRFYNEILKTQGKKSNKITTFLHALSTTDNQFQKWPLFIAGCNFLMSVIWQVKKFWTMLYCTETKHLIWI